MFDKNDLSLAAVTLVDLPSLDELVLQVDRRTWRALKPVLKRMPLLNLLHEILSFASRSEEKEKRALLDVARLAIAKHEYTRRLYSELVDAVTTSSSKIDSPLPNLPKEDALLAMEMLSLMAELFAISGMYERGVLTFRVAEGIADRFGLILNKGIVLHQLGTYDMYHGEFAKAEAALRKAAQVFAPISRDLERKSNYQRTLVYKLRLQSEIDPPVPDDIETIIARDPEARALILLALAQKAVDKDDMAGADTLLDELRERDSKNETISHERLITEARLARRNGEFEKAELILKRAAKTSRWKGSGEIAWQLFYLARDLGHIEESKAILETLKGESESVRIDFQQAIVAQKAGDIETAERLFRRCLEQTDKDDVRADCMGNLALISQNDIEAHCFLHKAIGLYVKLDRKLDHAISLSHLAVIEFEEALSKQEAGWPKEVLSQFRRADNLLQHAQEIAESLGADSFLLDLIMNRAHLEMNRERYNLALRYFNKAATTLELTYLSMTDRPSANLYLSTYTTFYGLAINCAVLAGKANAAFLFTERSKARRFLRDAGETTYEDNTGPIYSLSAKERELLSKIQPIRSRLIQQRSLALQEQQVLFESEQELRNLWREMRQSPELSTSLSKRIHQPLEVEVLRQIIFDDEPDDNKEEMHESDEDAKELPGGQVMQCDRCFIYNRITSTFCSACSTILPKSASINLNLWSGQASEEELKQAFADELYNKGAKLFNKGKIEQSEPFFEEAMTYASHPDYSFFYGLCRLKAGDPTTALQMFNDMRVQQYASRYPFWPAPVSPDNFRNCVENLRLNQCATEAFDCLMDCYIAYSQRRRDERRKKQRKDN